MTSKGDDGSKLTLREKLEKSRSFDLIFDIVKTAVEKTLGIHRAGLTLVLAELPTPVGAYHIIGSNLIVMNKTILDALSAKAKSHLEINSYVFHVLAHEYLHSFGYTSETEVRQLVHKVSSDNFGPDHLTTKIAGERFTDIYPELEQIGAGKIGKDFEVIRDFDKSSMPYIG